MTVSNIIRDDCIYIIPTCVLVTCHRARCETSNLISISFVYMCLTVLRSSFLKGMIPWQFLEEAKAQTDDK